jgi:hypothetical protein
MNESTNKPNENTDGVETIKVDNRTPFNKFLPLILILSLCAFIIFLCVKCNQNTSDYVVNSAIYNPNTNAVSLSTSTPSIEKQLDSVSETTSHFGRFEYSYKTVGGVTTALFFKNFIPRDDKIFVRATKDVIKKAFEDEVTEVPLLTQHNGQNKVRLDSSKYTYFILPVKEDTGETHSLVISRELKAK